MLPLIMNYLQAQLARTRDEDGAVTVEYGILVVFIAIALAVVVGVLVTGIGDWFQNISDNIGDADGGTIGG